MAQDDDKPLPPLDQPSAMEPLLKRIAEGVERLERKQPPAVPASMPGGESAPAMPPSQRQPDQPPPNLSPQQFANAGNINIGAPEGQKEPGVFGRAAISLQSMTNMMADYGVQSPMIHSLTSYAKTASLMAGDTHTRGEQLAGKGLRSNVGGNEQDLLRSLQLNRGRDSEASEPDSSPQIARNDLKDSLDGLKESIDQLKDVVKEMGGPQKSGSASRQSYPFAQPSPTVQGKAKLPRPVAISVQATPANIQANTI